MFAPPCFGPFKEPSAAAIAEYVSVPEEETTCVVKGRVVTAAVLHVENEGKIEDLRLQRSVLLIRSEHQ